MKIGEKKGVSDIITTVLLVLLAIAAVGIIWVVFQKFITTGTTGIGSSADCLSTDLEITNADVGGTSVSVKRIAGPAELKGIKLLVNGSSITGSGLDSNKGIGESYIVTVPALAVSDKIEVAAIVVNSDGTDTTCTVADSYIVTA